MLQVVKASLNRCLFLHNLHQVAVNYLQQGSFLAKGFSQSPSRPPEIGHNLLTPRGRHIVNGVNFQHKLGQQTVFGDTLHDSHQQPCVKLCSCTAQ